MRKSTTVTVTRNKLRLLRVLEGLTQAGLANKLTVHRSAVCRWESGERNPKPKHKKALAEILKVDNPEVLFRKEDSRND